MVWRRPGDKPLSKPRMEKLPTHICVTQPQWVNTLSPRQDLHHFADDTFKRIFGNENVRVLMAISLKFVPKGPINNIQALFQIMAWRWLGDKPLSEPMMVCLPTHICVTRPEWFNKLALTIADESQDYSSKLVTSAWHQILFEATYVVILDVNSFSKQNIMQQRNSPLCSTVK